MVRPSASSSPSAVPGVDGGSGGLIRATLGSTPRAASAARVAAGSLAAAFSAAPLALRALPPTPSSFSSGAGFSPASWICSSLSSPFSSSVTPQYGLPKRKPSQPPGLTSSRILSSKSRPLLGRHPDALPRLERVLLGQRQRRPGSGRCRSRTPRRRTCRRRRCRPCRIAAEREFLAVGQPVAVAVGNARGGIVAVGQSVAVAVELAGSVPLARSSASLMPSPSLSPAVGVPVASAVHSPRTPAGRSCRRPSGRRRRPAPPTPARRRARR